VANRESAADSDLVLALDNAMIQLLILIVTSPDVHAPELCFSDLSQMLWSIFPSRSVNRKNMIIELFNAILLDLPLDRIPEYIIRFDWCPTLIHLICNKALNTEGD
jgi:hypothetical protein